MAGPSSEPPPNTTPSSMAGASTAQVLSPGEEEAIFAGGCFWCMEQPFEALDGVSSVVSDTPVASSPNLPIGKYLQVRQNM